MLENLGHNAITFIQKWDSKELGFC